MAATAEETTHETGRGAALSPSRHETLLQRRRRREPAADSAAAAATDSAVPRRAALDAPAALLEVLVPADEASDRPDDAPSSSDAIPMGPAEPSAAPFAVGSADPFGQVAAVAQALHPVRVELPAAPPPAAPPPAGPPRHPPESWQDTLEYEAAAEEAAEHAPMDAEGPAFDAAGSDWATQSVAPWYPAPRTACEAAADEEAMKEDAAAHGAAAHGEATQAAAAHGAAAAAVAIEACRAAAGFTSTPATAPVTAEARERSSPAAHSASIMMPPAAYAPPQPRPLQPPPMAHSAVGLPAPPPDSAPPPGRPRSLRRVSGGMLRLYTSPKTPAEGTRRLRRASGGASAYPGQHPAPMVAPSHHVPPSAPATMPAVGGLPHLQNQSQLQSLAEESLLSAAAAEAAQSTGAGAVLLGAVPPVAVASARPSPAVWNAVAISPGHGFYDLKGNALQATSSGLVAMPSAGPLSSDSISSSLSTSSIATTSGVSSRWASEGVSPPAAVTVRLQAAMELSGEPAVPEPMTTA